MGMRSQKRPMTPSAAAKRRRAHELTISFLFVLLRDCQSAQVDACRVDTPLSPQMAWGHTTKANAKAPFMNCNGCFMVEPKLFSKEVDILLQAIP